MDNIFSMGSLRCLVLCHSETVAYNKEKILKQCLEVIEKEKITFFNDLCLFIAPSLSTLYEWELQKSEQIKEAIEKQRSALKRNMRKNWVQSENATLQIAAYRLMASPEEINSMTLTRVESKADVNVSGGIVLELDNGCEPIKKV